jgi:hypothetical protein
MISKGGMIKLIALTTMNVAALVIAPVTAGVNNITLESHSDLGSQSSVMVTTLDFGTHTDEIIDVDLNEKRRRDDIHRRRVRPRFEDNLPHTPTPPIPSNVIPAPPGMAM